MKLVLQNLSFCRQNLDSDTQYYAANPAKNNSSNAKNIMIELTKIIKHPYLWFLETWMLELSQYYGIMENLRTHHWISVGFAGMLHCDIWVCLKM